METTQAAHMSISPATVSDRTPIRATAGAHNGSGGSGQVRYLRPPFSAVGDSQPSRSSRPEPARTGLGGATERRRLERDLHDGVQNELVSLLTRLKLLEDDPDTPPGLADKFAALADHVIVALDSVREITHGISPRPLAKRGLRAALRERAARTAIDVSLEGSAPRRGEDVEAAVYFACSEAIQNAAKHAGRGVLVKVRLHHRNGMLVVRIADDGRGFHLLRGAQGKGVKNIRDRIQELGGSVIVASEPGRGTVLTLAVPWPPATSRRP